MKVLTKREINKKNRLEREKLERKVARQINKLAKEMYSNWRYDVYKRDNYTCMICGKYLKDGNAHNMQAHHILDKKNWPEYSVDLNNGITLCYRDHKVGKYCPHMNALSFAMLLKKKRPEQYEYLLKKVKSELSKIRIK